MAESIAMNLMINGNYLIIETENRESKYKQTTEFQLKNVFFKTENDSFIIRDSSYRAIITFADVDNEYISIEKTQVNIDELFRFLCVNTGSIGLAIPI